MTGQARLIKNKEKKITDGAWMLAQVEAVNYPGLASSPFHGLAQSLFKGSGGGVLSFEVKGGVSTAQALLKVCHRRGQAAATADFLSSRRQRVCLYCGSHIDQLEGDSHLCQYAGDSGIVDKSVRVRNNVNFPAYYWI